MILNSKCLVAIEKRFWEERKELDAVSEILEKELLLLEFLWEKHPFYNNVRHRIESTYANVEYWKKRMEDIEKSLEGFAQLSYRKQCAKIKTVNLSFTFKQDYVEKLLEMVDKRDDLNVLRFIVWVNIRRAYEDKITATDAKKQYKLSKNDLIGIPSESYRHNLYGNECKMYAVEDLKKYVRNKYGQKLLDEKRQKSQEKGDKIRQTRAAEEERKERLWNERKQIVLDLLAKFNLYYDEGAYFTNSFINGYNQLNEERIVKEMSRFNYLKKMVERRRSVLEDELEKYGLEIREDSALCKKHIEEGYRTTEFVVNVMRDMNFIVNKTNFRNNVRYHNKNNLPQICEKFSKIFDTKDDIPKTLAIYDKIAEKKLRIQENIPSSITQRIAQCFAANPTLPAVPQGLPSSHP